MLAFTFFRLSFGTLFPAVKAEVIFSCFETMRVGVVTLGISFASGKTDQQLKASAFTN